jgi:hypothetical protein
LSLFFIRKFSCTVWSSCLHVYNCRKVKWSEAKGNEVKWGEVRWSEVKWGEVRWSEVKWGEVRWSKVKWSDVMWGEVKWSDVKWGEVMWCEVKWSGVKWSEVRWAEVKWSEVKWSEVKWSEVKWSEVKWSKLHKCLVTNADLTEGHNKNKVQLRCIDLTHEAVQVTDTSKIRSFRAHIFNSGAGSIYGNRKMTSQDGAVARQ